MYEIWRAVIGYAGLYEVSNLGRVRSLYDCRNQRMRKVPLIMKEKKHPSDYRQVELYKDSIGKKYLIHRLVCESFILNRKMKADEFCDHINTIRHDNRVENLRVCTCKENNNNPLTCKKNSLSKSIPLTLRGVKDGSVYHFKSGKEASLFFGYDRTKIGTYISYARKNNKRTIKINGEEFYFSLGNR